MFRGIVVTFGGQALLSLAALAGGGELLAAARARRRPRAAALTVLAAALAYELALAPWMRSWGATAAERARRLPGDEEVPEAGVEITQAVTVRAPVAEVWPWLAQIGQDRGGFYSYEWLENLAGCRMHNADRVHPEWQRREVGEPVWLHPQAPPLAVTRFEPGRLIGLAGWGVFLVEPDGESGTRLLARGRVPAGMPALLYRATLEVPHFVMQRKMLLGLKARAEAGAA
ncbi:MAG: hypothetical protein U0R71_12275 [Solirubrobacterales bacterium]